MTSAEAIDKLVKELYAFEFMSLFYPKSNLN